MDKRIKNRKLYGNDVAVKRAATKQGQRRDDQGLRERIETGGENISTFEGSKELFDHSDVVSNSIQKNSKLPNIN